MQRMLDDGIATRRGVMNAHSEAGLSGGHLAARAAGRERAARSDATLALPLFHQITFDEQERVVAALEQAVRVWGGGRQS